MRNKLLLLTVAIFTLTNLSFAEENKEFDSDVHIEVSGMVCDFCARGLEKVFNKRSEVEKITVSLNKGTIDLFFKEGKNIDDPTITKLINDNGISVKKIHRK